MSTEECNADVYKHGGIVGVFDMPKEEAEAACKKATEESGCLHDWHYVGGRVVVKALPKGFYNKKPESPWA